MKTSRICSLCAAALVALPAAGLFAQPPGGGGGPGGGGPGGGGRGIVRPGHPGGPGVIGRPGGPHGEGDWMEGFMLGLGPNKEQFLVWMKAIYGGDRFFNREDGRLRHFYDETYEHIVKGLVSDRVNEPDGRKFKEELVAIGRKALELRGSEPQLKPEDAGTIATSLKELNGKIKAAVEATGEVPENLQTPLVNVCENTCANVLQWAAEANVLPAGKINTFESALASLESREDRYKDDSKLSDYEREKLHEEAREVGIEIAKAIHKS